ncbi:MAG TPA: hypothetical protein PKY56_00265 [Candidatus Kapabacteria bacterium]|nr:hypothetical protein [Candidatus Kapabacteria bacterium]HPO61568.1 hypothetical protein [Candidatus Kapabacteria bacterium]
MTYKDIFRTPDPITKIKKLGVATYSTSKVLPNEYKNILPDEKALKELM